jgi:hypothetical protein
MVLCKESTTGCITMMSNSGLSIKLDLISNVTVVTDRLTLRVIELGDYITL